MGSGRNGENFKKFLQSKKGLRQEGGHQSYEMNSLKLLNDKV